MLMLQKKSVLHSRYIKKISYFIVHLSANFRVLFHFITFLIKTNAH